jgi:hypothetical protein
MVEPSGNAYVGGYNARGTGSDSRRRKMVIANSATDLGCDGVEPEWQGINLL